MIGIYKCKCGYFGISLATNVASDEILLDIDFFSYGFYTEYASIRNSIKQINLTFQFHQFFQRKYINSFEELFVNRSRLGLISARKVEIQVKSELNI